MGAPARAARMDRSVAGGVYRSAVVRDDGAMDSKDPTIGLLADPGTPELLAMRIADDVADRISQETGQRWHVEVSQEKLPLSPQGTIDLEDHAPELLSRRSWDYVIYLSDLPRYVDDEPMVSEVTAEARAALISVPALGGIRLAARTRGLVLALVRSAMAGTDEQPDVSTFVTALGRSNVRAQHAPESDDLIVLLLTGRGRHLRMLAGMVRSNRPGKLLPALTGCMAAAVAAGVFGVFYGTMAPVSDALPVWRLVLISVLVIAALSGWLIVRNKLWNSTPGRDVTWRRGLDNASTVITVGLSVVLLYAALVVILLIMAFAVLDTAYLRDELLHQIGVLDYVKLGWLCASMGTMAGALGANFDSEESVREATFSRRYHERRKLFDSYEEGDEANVE